LSKEFSRFEESVGDMGMVTNGGETAMHETALEVDA
jgi:hypothetical protein